MIGGLKNNLKRIIDHVYPEQGITCQTCNYNAHYRCTKFVPGVCPLPDMDKQKRIGLNSVNIQAGTGTAYESVVSLPKPKVLYHGLFNKKKMN